MSKRVQLPTGEIGEFPDEMADAQIESALRKQFPANKAFLYELPPNVQKHPWIQTAIYGAKRPPAAKTAEDLATLASLATIPLGGAGAAGLAGRIGWPLLRRAAPYIGRVAGAALPAAAAAPVAGKSPVREAGKAALGAAAGEAAVGASTNVLQMVKPWAEHLDIRRLGGQIGKTLPEFTTGTAEELYGLAKKTGSVIRKDMLDTALNPIRAMVSTPHPMGTPQFIIPSLGPKPVTFDEAVRALRESSDRALHPNPKILSFEDRVKLRAAQAEHSRLRREIPAALERVRPGSGRAFDEAYGRASAQAAYLSIVNKAAKDGVPVLRKMQEEIQKDPESYRARFGQYFPQVERAIFRGQTVGPAVQDRPGQTAWNELTSLLFRRLKGPEAPFVAGPVFRTAADIAAQQPTVQGAGVVALGGLQHLLPFRQPRERIGFGQRY